jgi:hypothetical protein
MFWDFDYEMAFEIRQEGLACREYLSGKTEQYVS